MFAITARIRYSRHRLFESLPAYHQYQYMSICDEKRFGKRKMFQLEFFEGPEDTDKDLWWSGGSFSKREYDRKRQEVPEKYYKWTTKRVLVNLLKCDTIELTTYQEIAKRFLDEERM